jgi:hypothetical protein
MAPGYHLTWYRQLCLHDFAVPKPWGHIDHDLGGLQRLVRDKSRFSDLYRRNIDMVRALGKCEICGKPTNTSFGSPGNLHYFCEEHETALFEKVTGEKPEEAAEPEG